MFAALLAAVIFMTPVAETHEILKKQELIDAYGYSEEYYKELEELGIISEELLEKILNAEAAQALAEEAIEAAQIAQEAYEQALQEAEEAAQLVEDLKEQAEAAAKAANDAQVAADAAKESSDAADLHEAKLAAAEAIAAAQAAEEAAQEAADAAKAAADLAAEAEELAKAIEQAEEAKKQAEEAAEQAKIAAAEAIKAENAEDNIDECNDCYVPNDLTDILLSLDDLNLTDDSEVDHHILVTDLHNDYSNVAYWAEMNMDILEMNDVIEYKGKLYEFRGDHVAIL